MRVVMLSNSFPPQVGGIQEHVSNLAQTLARQGHQLKIVTVRRNNSERVRDTFAGLDVIRVPQLNLPKTMNAQYLAIATALLVALRIRGQADVVEESCLPGLLAVRWLRRMLEGFSYIFRDV